MTQQQAIDQIMEEIAMIDKHIDAQSALVATLEQEIQELGNRIEFLTLKKRSLEKARP